MAALSKSLTEKVQLKEKLGPFEALGGYILPELTFRINPKQFNAATVATGNQFTGFEAVGATLEAVVSGGGASNGTYPNLVGSYQGSPGPTIKMVLVDGRYINVTSMPDFGLGIDPSGITHTKYEPLKYASSEQSNP